MPRRIPEAMWSLMPVEAGQLGPRPVIRSTRSSALPSPSVSRKAERNGAWTTKSVSSTHSRPMTHQSFSAKTRDLAVLDRQHAIDRLGGRAGHVHRVRADVERAVGRGDDRGGKEYVGRRATSSIFQPEARGRPAGGASCRSRRRTSKPSTTECD